MAPAQLFPQLGGDRSEFFCRHLRETIIVDDRPAIGLTASDNIARRRLTDIFAADAVC